MDRFEYKVLDAPTKGFWSGGKIDHQALADRLNELGKMGWEVVTMSDTTMYNNASRSMIIILKRNTLN